MKWLIDKKNYLCLQSPRLMGILNVTPDSFFDGGQWRNVSDAVDHATTMLEEGADLIDIGGESTRPGSKRVSSEEQIDRVAPVIERIIKRHPDAILSIDTTQSKVAKCALDLGVSILNDVSSGEEDEGIFELAASYSCGLILMHRVNTPEKDVYSYDTVNGASGSKNTLISKMLSFFKERCARAISLGVSENSIVLDLGLGFGKSVEENYLLMNSYPYFFKMGRPFLCAVSRKSFLGAVIDESEPENRLEASVAAAVAQFLSGIRIFRVHDITPHRRALAVANRLATSCSSVNMSSSPAN